MLQIAYLSNVQTLKTMMLSGHSRPASPSRKRMSAISRRTGIVEIIAGVFQSINASYRACRRATWFSDGPDIVVHWRYSRSHCFEIIQNSAAARLRMRLRNHKVLIQIVDPLAWMGGDGVGMSTGTILLFASCWEIWLGKDVCCMRRLLVAWLLSG